MQGINVSKVCNNVMDFFKFKIEKADRLIGFAKRKSKLTAKLFFSTFLMGCLGDTQVTLEGLSLMLRQRGVSISKQGLHQRFNENATKVIKELFQQALVQFKTEKKDITGLLSAFSSIQLTDSTGIELPTHLRDMYRAFGGASSEAGLKLQTTFEYLDGQIRNITITESRQSDQSFDAHLDQIEKKALYLQDQGYFKFCSFAKIIESGAYFISRCPANVVLFDEKNQKILLLEELKTVEKCLDKQVWIGGKKKIPVRIVITRLNEIDAEKRARKIKRDHQRRCTTPSASALEMSNWSVYITNIDEGILSSFQIHLVYMLRWQIELLFKLFKSESGINKINGRSINRILCEIYGKLICVIQLLYFCIPARWQENQNEISFRKAYKILKSKSVEFFNALESSYLLSKFIKNLFESLMIFSRKDRKRNSRRSTYQKIIDSSIQERLYDKGAA